MKYQTQALTQAEIERLPESLKLEVYALQKDTLDYDPELAEIFADNDALIFKAAKAALKAAPEPEPKSQAVKEKKVEGTIDIDKEADTLPRIGDALTDGPEHIGRVVRAESRKAGEKTFKIWVFERDKGTPERKYEVLGLGTSSLQAKNRYLRHLSTALPTIDAALDEWQAQMDAMHSDGKPKPIHTSGPVSIYDYKDGKLAVVNAKAYGSKLVAAGAKFNPNAKIAEHKGAYIIAASLDEVKQILQDRTEAEAKPKPTTMPKADPKPGTYHERVAPILAALENEDEDMPKKKVLEYAARVQEVRKDSVVANDNRKEARKVLDATYLNLLRWITAPGRYDLQGVDIAADKAVTVVARVNKVGIFNRFRR